MEKIFNYSRKILKGLLQSVQILKIENSYFCMNFLIHL